MNEHRDRARHRGLRMAAKVAAVASLLAATAAHAETADTVRSQASEASRQSAAPVVSAADLADRVRLGGAKKCGCAPCWGPPAPPAMSWLEEQAA